MKSYSLQSFTIIAISLGLILSLSSGKKLKYMPQPEGFVYVPSGTMSKPLDPNPVFSHSPSMQYSISALWMSETEVTNLEYRLFLKDLLDSGKLNLYKQAYPDTTKLKHLYWIGSRYNINYFTNPYFNECPVVCVASTQVELYCQWLTKKYRHLYPTIDYPEFRLPTIIEWEYAARGGKGISYFPWGGEYMRNSRGCFLANFYYIDDKLMDFDTFSTIQYLSMPRVYYYWDWDETTMDETNNLKTLHLLKKKKYTFLGMPVWANAYFPNDFGLYNISGNVAEMVIGSDNKIRCVGGSYKTPGAYLRLDLLLDHHTKDTFPLEDVGFRVVVNYKMLN